MSIELFPGWHEGGLSNSFLYNTLASYIKHNGILFSQFDSSDHSKLLLSGAGGFESQSRGSVSHVSLES